MSSEFDPDQTPEVPEPVDEPSTGPVDPEPVPEPGPHPEAAPEPIVEPEPVPEPKPVETPEQAQARILDELYPYPRDPRFHRLAYLFFNMPHLSVDADGAHAMATWVFDRLGCGGPGTGGEPSVKYDALGGSGAPHEHGVWIKVTDDRMTVEVTTPEVVLTDMTEAKLAEVIANAQAALVAKRARTAKEA